MPVIRYPSAGYIKGDGALRISQLLLEHGTAANSIKASLINKWDGDTIAATDNIVEGGGTVGNFTLNSDKGTLTIEAAGLTGSAVAVIAVYEEYSTTEHNTPTGIESVITANDIVISFTSLFNGALRDLPADLDVGDSIKVHLSYLTSF